MPDPDTRVWLLPNGNMATIHKTPGGWSVPYRYAEHSSDGQELDGHHFNVRYHDSLPEGAQPMVPIPSLGTDVFRDEDGGIVCGHVTMHRDWTVPGMRTVIAQHAASLTRAYAALEFLEREAAAVSVPVQPECVPPHTGPDCSPDCENVAPGIPVTPESLEAHAEWLAECRPLAAEDLRGEAKRLRAEAEQAAAEQVSADARRKVLAGVTDKLTDAITGALVSWWGSERVHPPFVAHNAAAIREAGEARTECRQVIYAPDGSVSMWAAKLTSASKEYAVHDESREVLTLTGDWEPVEVPATAAENGEQRC